MMSLNGYSGVLNFAQDKNATFYFYYISSCYKKWKEIATYEE